MQFKITLTPDRPTQGELVLESETPISGLNFIEEVGKCLRRSIDHISRERHVTLGAVSFYEITVPQQMAIESGLFETKSTVPIIVENNLLSHYIFYGASVDNKASGRPCYPYMSSEATLISYVDELQFLMDWASLGFPERLIWNNGMMDGTYGSNTDCGACENKNKLGCDGCTCGKEPPKHHHHHHEHDNCQCDEPKIPSVPSCPADPYYPDIHGCPKPNGWSRPRFHGATVHPPVPPMPPHGHHHHPSPIKPKHSKNVTAIL
ncbi:MAG: hypothetical protein NC489_08040 [Ruminococcus flavefaciens]|nr:hypothetical protein [Ruminococcus flavefaciens]